MHRGLFGQLPCFTRGIVELPSRQSTEKPAISSITKFGRLKISLGEKDELAGMNNRLLFGTISFSPLSCHRETPQRSDVLVSSSSSTQASLPSVRYNVSDSLCKPWDLSGCLLLTKMTVQTSLSHRGTGATPRAIHLVHRV